MKCPQCGSDALDVQRDRATHDVAAADGELVLRCRNCQEAFIVAEAAWEQQLGRGPLHAYAHIATAGLGTFMSLGLAAFNWIYGLWLPWWIALILAVAFGLLGTMGVVLQRSLLLRRYRVANPKVEDGILLFAMLLMMLALAAVAVWGR